MIHVGFFALRLLLLDQHQQGLGCIEIAPGRMDLPADLLEQACKLDVGFARKIAAGECDGHVCLLFGSRRSP